MLVSPALLPQGNRPRSHSGDFSTLKDVQSVPVKKWYDKGVFAKISRFFDKPQPSISRESTADSRAYTSLKRQKDLAEQVIHNPNFNQQHFREQQLATLALIPSLDDKQFYIEHELRLLEKLQVKGHGEKTNRATAALVVVLEISADIAQTILDTPPQRQSTVRETPRVSFLEPRLSEIPTVVITHVTRKDSGSSEQLLPQAKAAIVDDSNLQNLGGSGKSKFKDAAKVASLTVFHSVGGQTVEDITPKQTRDWLTPGTITGLLNFFRTTPSQPEHSVLKTNTNLALRVIGNSNFNADRFFRDELRLFRQVPAAEKTAYIEARISFLQSLLNERPGDLTLKAALQAIAVIGLKLEFSKVNGRGYTMPNDAPKLILQSAAFKAFETLVDIPPVTGFGSYPHQESRELDTFFRLSDTLKSMPKEERGKSLTFLSHELDSFLKLPSSISYFSTSNTLLGAPTIAIKSPLACVFNERFHTTTTMGRMWVGILDVQSSVAKYGFGYTTDNSMSSSQVVAMQCGKDNENHQNIGLRLASREYFNKKIRNASGLKKKGFQILKVGAFFLKNTVWDFVLSPIWKSLSKPFEHVIKDSKGTERTLAGKIWHGAKAAVKAIVQTGTGIGILLYHPTSYNILKTVTTPIVGIVASFYLAYTAMPEGEKSVSRYIGNVFKNLLATASLTLYSALTTAISPLTMIVVDGRDTFKTDPNTLSTQRSERQSLATSRTTIHRTRVNLGLQQHLQEVSGRVTPTQDQESVSRQQHTPVVPRESAVSIASLQSVSEEQHSEDGRDLPRLSEDDQLKPPITSSDLLYSGSITQRLQQRKNSLSAISTVKTEEDRHSDSGDSPLPKVER